MADIRKREGKKGPTWQLRFSDPNSGKPRYKTFKRRKDLDAFLIDLPRSDYVHDSDTITVTQATDRWLDVCERIGRKGREPVEHSTLKQYKLHAPIIKGMIGASKLNALTPVICDKLRDDLLAAHSRKYAKKILASFKAILSQARSDGHMRHDPAENTVILVSKRHTKSEEAAIPSVEEVRSLLAKAAALRDGSNEQMAKAWSRYYPFFLVLAYSGMRPGEAIGLPWKNVDFKNNTIKVTQDAGDDGSIGLPKSAAAYRTIHMPRFVMLELMKWELKCPASEHGLVFPNWSGSVESHSNLTHRGWYSLLKACGMMPKGKPPKYPLKSLRHVRASLEIHNGATAKELQVLMGHSSVQITFDVYGHLFKDHAASRAARADLIAEQLSATGKSVARL
jgi:integrase